jgi:A/G-specific adenine glycosylase
MEQQHLLASAVEPLIAWFAQHRRPLPWRDSPTPYHVWLSEVMLQQTRIEAVLPYYHRFLEVCPTVAHLAAIDDDILMKLWQGLGYYSRARNLKAAAIMIMERYGGEFPADYDALLSLPGVGAYTAGAIASIAFSLPTPAVDGNVLRVITRLCGDHADITDEKVKRRIAEQLRAVYPRSHRAGEMTQGLMELGQRVCIPNGTPHCGECPWGAFCQARARGEIDCIPNRPPKKPRRIEKKTILLLQRTDLDGVTRYALRKRGENGLLAGLWEFPGIDGHLSQEQATEAICGLCGDGCVRAICQAPHATHIFTHIEWHMIGYLAMCDVREGQQPLVWASIEEIQRDYALPSALRAYFAYLVNNHQQPQ